jgi:hypothetical protein
MRWLPLLLFTLPGSNDLGLINQLDECVQLRFQTLQADASGRIPLGMSRIARPSSFGQHFAPVVVSQRDFEPQSAREREVLAKLEDESVQVGFYLFGPAILAGGPEAPNPRALKGPGAMTKGTPRAAWYPTGLSVAPAPGGALPDWRTIYPLAQSAMKSFAGGGSGFETTLDSWHIAARPVLAGQQRCMSCHTGSRFQTLGGVFYAYRRAR